MRSGLIAEFGSPDGLLDAARVLRARGYRRLDAFTPYRIDHLDEVLGLKRTLIPFFALGAALTGALLGFLLIYFCNAYDYPINVGGRPLNSIPTNVPIMFEAAVLFCALTTFTLCLVFARMPRLHHSMSEIEGFERTSTDRFWLTLEYPDPAFEVSVLEELREQGALEVRVVGVVP
jgi:hypothetical protein